MTEFTVDITSRSSGIILSNYGNFLGVHQVTSPDDSMESKLGLLPGDVLISINNLSVVDMSPDKALNIFDTQQLPFTATFERFSSDDTINIDKLPNINVDIIHPTKSDCSSDIESRESDSDSYEESKEDDDAYTICINDNNGSESRRASQLGLEDKISASYDVEHGLYIGGGQRIIGKYNYFNWLSF